MTLTYKHGEFGEVNPIKCVDSKGNDANIAYADVTKSKVFIMSEGKVKLLLTITDTDFTISTPNVNWTPTKTQSETLVAGNYSGEAHLQNTAETRRAIYEFPVVVEKSKIIIPP